MESFGEQSYSETKKEILDHSRKMTELSEKETVDTKAWGIYDSPLLNEYPNYPTDIDPSYENTFEPLFVEEGRYDYGRLKGFIEETLSSKRGKALGVDFGGPGRRVFAEFSPGLFAKTAGIVLTDFRPDSAPPPPNHSLILGDIFAKDTQKKVLEWSNGQPIDLFFERLEGGLTSVPLDPRFMINAISWWYKNLSEGGLVFAQLPTSRRGMSDESKSLLYNWVDFIMANYQGLIMVKIKGEAMMLHKMKGAPNFLPLLPERG